MAKTIHCTDAQTTLDLDVDSECDFVARADNDHDALAEITDHLQTVHNWNEMYQPELERVRAHAIRSEV